MNPFVLKNKDTAIGTIWADRLEISEDDGVKYLRLITGIFTAFITSFKNDTDIEIIEDGTITIIKLNK